MSALIDSHGFPDILCGTVLLLGDVASKSRCGADFNCFLYVGIHVDQLDGFACRWSYLLYPHVIYV